VPDWPAPRRCVDRGSQVFFYQTEGMKYYTQVECRNRHGALKGGKKVTGLCYDTSRSAQVASEQLLVSTNDSRLRLYQTDDYSMLCKYKGLTNDNMQIKATFSEDGSYVISGSENGNVYLWNATTQHTSSLSHHLNGFKKDRNSAYECFPATELNQPTNPPIVSVALFVPSAAVTLAARGTPHERANGANMMIVTADYSGKVRVFHRHALTNPAPPPARP
jgi:WD40 repeat protein